MVERPGNAPGAAILRGWPAHLCSSHRRIGADAGNRNRTLGVALRSSTFELHPRMWWSNGVTLPARRSCKDHLHPCACPLVPGRGFEPRSPALQAGAFTRLAFRAAWRFPAADRGQIPIRRRRRLFGADAGNRNRTFGVALRNSTFELHPRVWCLVEVTILASA